MASNATNKKGSRSICFADYDAVGFDCDHTLAQYNLYHLFKDTFEAMASYLINEKGYAKQVFKFTPSFCSRGIILDLEKGDFMKLAHDGKILRAFHGTRPIPKEMYESTIWPHYEELSRSMTNIGTKYRIFENFFDMASSILCAQIIDDIDEKHNGKPESYNIWPDVASAIRHIYIPEQYKGASSPFFSDWLKDADKYVERGNEKLKEWLNKMKAGRPMFVLSSAYEDIARATLQHTLGKDWQEYFDLAVFLAEKPGFFYKSDPFYHLSESGEQEKTQNLKNCKYVFGGNLKDLNDYLVNLTGKPNPKVLYFGDSQRSDIIPSKLHAKWDTVYILEEVGSEMCFYEHREDNLKEQMCDFENPSIMPWGSVFTDSFGKGSNDQAVEKTETLVHSVIRKYSDLVVPNIQYLFDYPLDHHFTTFKPENESSLAGFHPFPPQSLK